MHTHTKYGSSCAYMDPSALIHRAKQVGLDGVCITEHNQPWDRKAIERLSREHDFTVIGGIEVTTNHGDILVFGLHQSVLNVWEAEELRDMVERAGGVTIAAHPFRGHVGPGYSARFNPPLTVGTASQRPVFQLVDAVEVFNARAGPQEQEFAQAVSDNLNLKATGGSDAHSIATVGWAVTIFENRITSEEELIAEIKAGRFRGANGDSQELLRLSD